MRCRIHRGCHEIGGNCIEVESQGKRIVLDVGLPLKGEAIASVPDISGLMRGPENQTWYAAVELAALSHNAAEIVAPVFDHQTNSYLNELLKLTCHE